MNGCILVFGMPRSGTTWVGKLFDSHPDTLYRHEPDSVQRLSIPLYPEIESAPQYREELQRFVASLPRMRITKVVGKQPLFPKSYQSAAAFAFYRASVVVAKTANRIKRNFPCPYRPTAEGAERARLVWKSIESPGRLGVCVGALPGARAIHLIRHPCGHVASVLCGEAGKRFSESKPTADGGWRLKLLLKTAVGKARAMHPGDVNQLAPEEYLAWCWVLTEEKILADISGCERVMTVRYEDICADPITMTQRMFAFIGLDWQSQTEAFVRASTESTRRARNTDYYSVFKSPRESTGRWRKELAPKVIERILAVLGSSPLQHYYPDEVRAQAVAIGAAT